MLTDLINCILMLNAISGVISVTVLKRPVQHRIYNGFPADVPHSRAVRVVRVTTPSPFVVNLPSYRQRYHVRINGVRPNLYSVLVKRRPRPPSRARPYPSQKYNQLPPRQHFQPPRIPVELENGVPPFKPLEGTPVKPIEYNEVDTSNEDYPEQDDNIAPIFINDQPSFPQFNVTKANRAHLYKKPEEWSPPDKGEDGDDSFTPIQMYLQIRQSNKVKHVPKSDAIKDASTLEEVLNAPRLKELSRTTRVQEVYSEEGYEDAGYDHGGQIRHAEHDEAYAARDEGMFNAKDTQHKEDLYDPKVGSTKNVKQILPDDAAPQETKVSGQKTKVSKTEKEYSIPSANYKGEGKYSSRVKLDKEHKKTTEPSKTLSNSHMPPSASSTYSEGPTVTSIKAEIIEATTHRPNYIKIITTSEVPLKLITNQDANTGPAKVLKRLRKYNYNKRNRNPGTTTTEEPMKTMQASLSTDQRIILPTIGYINSLTTAHFGKSTPVTVSNSNVLTTPLNLTEALNYLRSNQPNKKRSPTSPGRVRVLQDGTFESKRLVNRNRRGVKKKERIPDEDQPDDGEEIHEEKNREIEEEERQRQEEVKEERAQYEKRLRDEIEKEEKDILRESLGHQGVKKEIDKLFKDSSEGGALVFDDLKLVTTSKPVDSAMYPYYFSKKIHKNSPLRYATNLKSFPRKSGRRMEFYESRDKLVKCPEMSAALEDIPRRNSSLESEGESVRIGGLGDRIACLKMKYFGEDPLDNPFFKEEDVGDAGRLPKVRRNARSDGFFHTIITEQPTRTVHVAVKKRDEMTDPSVLRIWKERIIPVTESVDESPFQLQASPLNFVRGSTSLPLHHRQTHVVPVASSSKLKPVQGRIVIPQNCKFVIGKIAALHGHKNLIVDCSDAVLIQEIRNDVRFLKIIPKTGGMKSEGGSMGHWDEGNQTLNFGRRMDTRNHTELQEEAEVRKGEMVDSNENSMNVADVDVQGRRKRAAERSWFTLTDFLRYLRNHENAPRPFRKNGEETPVIGSRYIQGSNGREMVYVRVDSAKPGRWI